MTSLYYIISSGTAFAERRPYDAAWTWLASTRRHATPVATMTEAEDVVRELGGAEDVLAIADDHVVGRIDVRKLR